MKLVITLMLFLVLLIGWLFPNPARFATQCYRYAAGINSLVEPLNPKLKPLVKEFHLYKTNDPVRVINYIVSRHIQYQSDYQTWGVIDYWPTVSEALDAGHEDCDGYAIVAASLAMRLGYTNVLIKSTPTHVWIEIPGYPVPKPPKVTPDLLLPAHEVQQASQDMGTFRSIGMLCSTALLWLLYLRFVILRKKPKTSDENPPILRP